MQVLDSMLHKHHYYPLISNGVLTFRPGLLGGMKKAASSADPYVPRDWSKPVQQTLTLTGHTNTVITLTELQDGTLASGSCDNTIKLWDREGNCLQTLEGHAAPVTTFHELRDGTLASGSRDKTIKLWDRSGKCLQTLEGHRAPIITLIPLRDGRLASGSYDQTVRLWEGAPLTSGVNPE